MPGARRLSSWMIPAVLAVPLATGCRSAVSDTAAPIDGTPVEVAVEPAAGDPAKTYQLPDDAGLFTARDVFELEWAADPRISPDGKWVVYVRGSMDVMADRKRSQLWLASTDGGIHRPLTSADDGDFMSPRWSPSGDRLLYIGVSGGNPQLYMRWMDAGQVARITNLQQRPGGIEWSPQGDQIALIMRVPTKDAPLTTLPTPPKGASWSEPPALIERVTYREDGGGYVEPGFRHLFVVPADGGSPRQLTQGDFHHGHPAWTANGKSVIVSANRRANWELEPGQSDLFSVAVADGAMLQLTNREGPDEHPRVSPDGKFVAYIGYDDRKMGHHVDRLYVKPLAGGDPRVLAEDLDRSVKAPQWSADGRGLYVAYDDQGNGKVAYIPLNGERRVVAQDLGGLSLGRPYGSGAYSVSDRDVVAYTFSRPDHPADVALAGTGDGAPRRLTHLNADLFAGKTLGRVEPIWVESSHDQRRIQGWILTPPGFDPKKTYPLILEIHGGPFANYGDRFAAEFQLYASAGYVVLYVNPRGSTSYGDAFANLIHHAYPGNDYDDLMSAVDAVLEKGYVDKERLYVTGGSGGGVLSSWIVGKTNRFRAAVVAKPVINWYSFVLTADHAPFFVDYWFPGPPWEQVEHYMERSPLSLVGNVQTPTMLLTGEADYRTPMSETEQYYQALKLRKIDTAMVRIPGASHSIASKPSRLVAKVAYVLGWFHRYGE